jgi:hypothetical protein
MSIRSFRRKNWWVAVILLAACRRGPTSTGAGLGADGSAGSGSKLAATSEPAVLARIERTACAGTCPVYQIEVWDDGAVRYDGRAHVEVLGQAEARLSAAELARVRAAFEEGRFTAMQPPPLVVIDLPTTILGYRNGERMHVIQYLGAPPEMQRLEHELETTVGASRWIGTHADRGVERKGVGTD